MTLIELSMMTAVVGGGMIGGWFGLTLGGLPIGLLGVWLGSAASVAALMLIVWIFVAVCVVEDRWSRRHSAALLRRLLAGAKR